MAVGNIAEELRQMGAPAKVIEAGFHIDTNISMGLHPQMEYVAYVRQWVFNQRRNSRYGR